jgi:hypothetical protein
VDSGYFKIDADLKISSTLFVRHHSECYIDAWSPSSPSCLLRRDVRLHLHERWLLLYLAVFVSDNNPGTLPSKRSHGREQWTTSFSFHSPDDASVRRDNQSTTLFQIKAEVCSCRMNDACISIQSPEQENVLAKIKLLHLVVCRPAIRVRDL